MGYYTIRLDPKVVEMLTIIFPLGKYSYLRLPMGYAGSADIFQAEMMDLMEALEYVRAYINDLLVITRGTLEDHLEQLGEVLRRLRQAGLKVNAAKSFSCTHEIENLGYILTRGGIKPQLVASHEATDTLHRAMWLAPYLPGGMVVAIAIKSVSSYIIKQLIKVLIL